MVVAQTVESVNDNISGDNGTERRVTVTDCVIPRNC